jgi:deazaflavin-dependent oxidoreductase (nitroreductase family)
MDATPPDEVVDSPVGWVAEHVRAYVASAGRQGHRRGGHYALLLTTRGRRSGRLRRTALYYGRDGASYVVVASNGGSARHPLWYLNLLAEPRAVVQVRGEVFPALARPATAEERPRLWRLMVAVFPYYEAYQRKTERETPVVVLERADHAPSAEAAGRSSPAP